MTARDIDDEIAARVAEAGFEVVQIRHAGSRKRPVLQVRIDRPEGETGVSVDDCARVSRLLEPHLDARQDLPDRYVLEVSSPGVDRPLVRERDFERFRGRRVALRGRDVLAGRARRLEGELLGLEAGGGGPAVRLRLPDGNEVDIPRDEIVGANLVFTWK